MEVFTILAILALIGLIIYSIFAINAYSISKNDYNPFKIGNFAIIAIPSFISIILYWFLEPESGKYVNYKDLNYIVHYLLVLGSCIVVGISIFKHTNNILISQYSTVLLFMGSILLIFRTPEVWGTP